MITPVGFDFGNKWAKVCIEVNGKLLFASIPSMYAFDKPIRIVSGQEKKINAFSLLFNVGDGKDVRLWFGNDTLESLNQIQKIDTGKYNKSHVQRLFQACLFQWSKQHNISISDLGKLVICASMPPGSYQKVIERRLAETAYRKAFNTGQSHMKIRTGKSTTQIVTSFSKLVREAVVFGGDIPRSNEITIVCDFGGGTDDIVLFNGSTEPLDSRTFNTGLIHTFQKINSSNPIQAELKIFRDKDYLPPSLLSYFNQKELMVQMALRSLPEQFSKKLYIIGGGATMIARLPKIKQTFLSLLPKGKVIIKNHFANSEANWRQASK